MRKTEPGAGDNVSRLFLDSNAPGADAPPVEGRRDGGQEQAVRVPKADKIEHLCKLHRKVEDAKTDFSDAVKAVAEKAGLEASVVKRFVVARSGEKYEAARRKSQQLELLFTELGEG